MHAKPSDLSQINGICPEGVNGSYRMLGAAWYAKVNGSANDLAAGASAAGVGHALLKVTPGVQLATNTPKT